MNIALIQFQSEKGNIENSIDRHLQWINEASRHQADLVLFPELSLTGYEPTLAAQLAMDLTDPRLQVFQSFSDAKNLTICAGMPMKQHNGTSISLVIFQPEKSISVYSKRYLHADEEPWFVPGNNLAPLLFNGVSIAFSICYELSVSQHAADAAEQGSTIYLNSAAKTQRGVTQAFERLSSIAAEYRMVVMFVNNIGQSDDFIGAGQSAAWDRSGKLVWKLSSDEEGILLVNTDDPEHPIITSAPVQKC